MGVLVVGSDFSLWDFDRPKIDVLLLDPVAYSSQQNNLAVAIKIPS
jgi:hypothetical protein